MKKQENETHNQKKKQQSIEADSQVGWMVKRHGNIYIMQTQIIGKLEWLHHATFTSKQGD